MSLYNKFTTEADAAAVSVDQQQSKAPSKFPTDIYPKELKDILLDWCIYSGYNLDLLATSIFYTAAVAIGNTAAIKVNHDWIEGPIFYFVLVAYSGEGKTPAINAAIAPIIEADQRARKRTRDEITQYKKDIEVYKKADKNNDTPEPVEPKEKITRLSDFTLEALYDRHSNNPRSIGIEFDEIIGLTRNWERSYSGGSEQQNLLTLHSRRSNPQTRKTITLSVDIPVPCVCILGGTQPKHLPELFAGGRAEDGFIYRCLFVTYDDHEKKPLNRSLPPYDISFKYGNIINRLFERSLYVNDMGTPCPELSNFSDQAKEIFFDWEAGISTQYNAAMAAQDYNTMGILAKMAQSVARMSLVLQVLYYTCNEATTDKIISERAVNSAIKLGAYYTDNARAAQRMATESKTIFAETPAKLEIYSKLPDKFALSEVVELHAQIYKRRDPNAKDDTIRRAASRFVEDETLFEKDLGKGRYMKKNRAENTVSKYELKPNDFDSEQEYLKYCQENNVSQQSNAA